LEETINQVLKSIESRRELGNCGSNSCFSDKSRKPLEHFLIIGPNESNNPEILCIYPSKSDNISLLDLKIAISFCYPEKNEIISEKHNFVFRLLIDSIPFYGVCLKFRINRLFPPFFASEKNDGWYCFCIITKHPDFDAHMQFLTFLERFIYDFRLSLIQTKYESESANTILPFINTYGILSLPSIKPSKKFFRQIQLFSKVAIMRTIHIDYRVTSNDTIHFHKWDSDIRICAKSTFNIFFSCLSTKNIVFLYSILLNEQSVVFVSSNILKYSMCTIASRLLLSPFVPSYTLLPVLPNHLSFSGILDSPTPILCGMSLDCYQSKTINHCIVNLDNNSIIHRQGAAYIPRSKDLEKSIKTILESGTNNESINKLMSLFSKHIYIDLVQHIAPCFVTDFSDGKTITSSLNMELLFDTLPKEIIPFYKDFVETSMFMNYTDHHSKNLEDTKQKTLDNECNDFFIPSFQYFDDQSTI